MTIAELLVKLGLEDNLSSALDTVGNKLTSFGSTAMSVGAQLTLGLSTPLLGFATVAVKTAADMESLMLGLQSIATAADPATKQFQRLQEVAKLPGLSLEQAIRGSINLQNAGFSAQQAERSISLVGNALALVGKGSADLNPVLSQLQQMSNKAKVVAGDLKPIMERVPQVAKAVREAFGTLDTEAIQKMGVSPATMIEAILSSLEKLNKAGDGSKNKFENFADAVDQAMARVGRALLPFVDFLISQVVPAIEVASKWFEGLDPISKDIAVGLGAIAVAAGPVLFYLGGMATVLGSVLKIMALFVPEATIAAGALSALTGAAVLLGQAALIGATAYAAWNIGAWAYSHIPAVKALGDMLGDLATKAARSMGFMSSDTSAGADLSKGTGGLEKLASSKGIDIAPLTAQFKAGTLTLEAYNTELNKTIRAHMGVASSTASLTPEIHRLEAVLKQHGITMTQGNLSADQYVATLRKMVAGFKTAATDGGKAAYDFEKAIKEAFSMAGVADTAMEAEKTQNAIKVLEKAYEMGKIPLNDFTAAHDHLITRLDMLREGFTTTEARAKAYKDAIAQINKMDAFINFTNNPLAGAPDINGSGKPVEVKLQSVGDIVKDDMSQATAATAEYERALKALGITHHATAAEMEQAWTAVKNSSVASSREKLEAERAYLTAVGTETGNLTNEQRRRLGEIDNLLKKQAIAVVPVWQEVTREVNRAFDSMARGLAKNIVEWKGFGDTLKSMLQTLAEGILEIFMQRLLNPLKQKVADILLGDGKGNGGILGGLTSGLSGVSGIIKNIFGGGGAASAASSIGTGDIFDTALGGIAGGGGGGGAGGIVGSIAGMANPINMITGGISAVSGIIGNFQQAKLEKTMNAIEESTRYLKGYMRDNIIPDEQVWWPRLGDIEMILHDDISPKITAMRDDIHTLAYPPPGSAKTPISVSGNLILGDGDIERFADKLVAVLKARGVYPAGK